MGSQKSKPKMPPTNPFEMQQYERDRRVAVAESELRQQKALKKTQKQPTERLTDQRDPKGPHVPPPGRRPSDAEADYELEAHRRMQDQLAWDAHTFVLNQLILSVQFFENYEKEMWQAVERNRRQENEETSKIEKHCKIVILPDRLHEAVDRRVIFRPRHGPDRDTETPLHTQTMYVVHENFEVTNPGERSNYSILTDAPIYKVEIDVPANEQDEHTGYVRLKCTENIYKIQSRKSRTGRPSRRTTTNNYTISGTSTPTSDYDYAYITALNTSQPLSQIAQYITLPPVAQQHPAALPEMCISTAPHFKSNVGNDDESSDDSFTDSEEEDEDASDHNNNNNGMKTMEDEKLYLNSKSFLAYFLTHFRERLAIDMGIGTDRLAEATWKGATIQLRPWNIVPAIACPWPNEAFEWIHRHREIRENPVTRQRFQWPTNVMVNKVVSFGCCIVPWGYAPKTGSNPYRELEWSICFPEAERYLESCLTAAQVKIYVIAKALLQTFVQPHLEARQNMFTSEHLRTHLFWQCENNYAAWPEDYLGEALVRFLNALLERIKRQRLPDYFLPKRNLFENIPERMMVDLHKLIFRITENPLWHVLRALRCLQFKSAFDEQFCWNNLYATMTVDNPLKIINPNFRTVDDEESDTSETTRYDGVDEDAEERGPRAMGAIGYYQTADLNNKVKRRRKSRKIRFLEAQKRKSHLEQMERKVSTESIDVLFPVKGHMEQLRRVLIYEMFINHYVEMARQSTHFASFNQGLIYLKQATRLCNLLRDDDRVEQARNCLLKIEAMHLNLQMERNRNSVTKPQLPRRESGSKESHFSNKNKFRIKSSPSTTIVDPYKNIEKKADQFIVHADMTVGQPQQRKPNATKLSKEEASTIFRHIMANRGSIEEQSIAVHHVSDLIAPPFTPRSPQKPLEAMRFFGDDLTSEDSDGGRVATPLTVRKANVSTAAAAKQLNGAGGVDGMKMSTTATTKVRALSTSSETDDFVTSL